MNEEQLLYKIAEGLPLSALGLGIMSMFSLSAWFALFGGLMLFSIYLTHGFDLMDKKNARWISFAGAYASGIAAIILLLTFL